MIGDLGFTLICLAYFAGGVTIGLSKSGNKILLALCHFWQR